jgi:3-hydroxy-9,10-secoandrosta-1,3,5(10)-triene-9,17-dione monooxygenase
MRGADSPQAAREVIAGVRDLLPTLRERAQDTEDARRIPDESIKSLQDTGFFKLLQPKPYGGYESTPVTFYTAVKLIASAWGSTGWVASILGVHPWHVALFDAQAQEDVWSEDVDVRISSSYAPMGTAQIVDGGCRLTGKWSFSSGCDHATWILLCVRRVRQAGGLLHLPAADQRLHHRRRLGHRGTSWYR